MALCLDLTKRGVATTVCRSLKAEFDNVHGGFTEEQFVKTFGSILGNNRLTAEQLTTLFLKIDANRCAPLLCFTASVAN